MKQYYRNFLIRDWQPADREKVGQVISSILGEYGLQWNPEEADQDVLKIEEFYHQPGGEFWVIENKGKLIGTAGYYPVKRGTNAVEIRKMYLLPETRGQGLGKFLLQQLEITIQARNFQTIWIETASVLKEAVKLYENSNYQPATGVETKRCDRIYVKYLPCQ